MARRELTEAEIFDLKRQVKALGDPRLMDLLERLTGEVLALRERESWSRQLHDLEGE